MGLKYKPSTIFSLQLPIEFSDQWYDIQHRPTLWGSKVILEGA